MKAGSEAEYSEAEYYIGIDISQEQLDVYIRPSDEDERYRNDRDGCEQLLARLEQGVITLVVIEAPGG